MKLQFDTCLPGYYSFHCPGCGYSHVYTTKEAVAAKLQWDFNGDTNSPTFSPSLLNRGGRHGSEHICHLFVRNGSIEFCSDCTHALAGKTVEMKEI